MVETSSIGVPAQAQATKDEAINQASDLKDTALEHVGAVADDAKEQASNVARDVRRELETQGDVQAKRAASMLHDVGSQLNDMASAGQPGPVAEVTRQLGDKSRQVASRLEEGGIQGIGDDLRRFARRSPGVFLFAAGAAGFVVTRMLRNAQGINAQGANASPGTSAPNGQRFAADPAPSPLPSNVGAAAAAPPLPTHPLPGTPR